MINKEKLLELLISKGLIKKEQVHELIKIAETEKKKIEDVILDKGAVDAEKFSQARAEIYNLPYENLVGDRISESIINVIPNEVAENYKIICFHKDGKKINVGLTDPDNYKAIEAVDFLAKEEGFLVEYFLISLASFKAAFKQYGTLNKELTSALQSKAKEEELLTLKEKDSSELKEVTKSAPVIKIVSVIIRHAVEGRASDIHIEPLQEESRVRYRIDGVLHTSLMLPRSIHNAVIARIKVMSNMKLDETRVPQDGRIRLIMEEKELDFRVSSLPLLGAEKMVMRILDTTKGAPALDELGFEGIQLKIIMENIKNTEGIMLITGPTGSGKSTTLFSIMALLNKESVNIATLEDPVEYQMKGINQSQIKPEIGYTFASGLRSFLRQDPDIIMVGEIRDQETAELAIHSALTGHLVLSTLHTTDAAGAVTRLVDMGMQPFLLGSTLHTSIAQRLTRRICENCKTEAKVTPKYIEEIKKDINEIGIDYIKEMIKDFDINNIKLMKGKGCPRCGNTGYSGRLALVEAIDFNDSLKDLVLSGKKSISSKEINASQKFITVKQDGVIKVLQGMTTMEEVLRVMKG